MLLPVLFSIGLLLPPQAAATSGTIQGVVRETGSRAPIAEARVFVAGAGVADGVTTDVNGKFEITTLPPGTYRLIVDKEGFAFDASAPAPLTVAAGRASTVTIELPRAAAITGQVRDEGAAPRRGVSVSVMRKVDGGTMQPPARPAVTDDLGRFRVDGLVPGDYLVLASPPAPGARDISLLPTYYPSVTDRQAAIAIPLAAGATAANVAITMISAPAWSITGRVVDDQGHPVSKALIAFVFDSVRTQANGQWSTRASIRALQAREDGSFRITGLGPGTYRLTPWPAPPPGTPPQLALDMTTVVNGTRATNVDVRSGDVSDVTVVLRPTR